MSFPRYINCLESGVRWIGSIPTHWQTRRLRTLVQIKKRIAGSEGPDVLSITQRGIRVRDTDSNEGQVASSYAHYQIVEPHDFAMNQMDLLTGWIDISDQRGVTSPDYRFFSVTAAEEVEPRFLLRVLQNCYTQKIFFSLGQGASHLGRWRLPTDAFQNFVVPLPSRDEQRRIATFLDRETAKIDALVEEQRRLIELLKEKRQTVISHAVTKGLDQSAPMKNSGVEWVGQIPTHWDVWKFGRGVVYQEGPGIMADDFQLEGVPLLRVSGAQGRWASLDGCNFLDPVKVAAKWSHFQLREGDLVISGSASMGTVCEVGPDTVGAVPYTGLIRLNPKPGLLKEYIRSLVISNLFLVQIDALKAGATIQHFGPTHLARMFITVPPTDEQRAIAARLAKVEADFAALIGEAESAETLLLERRAALITAAVTGKIDVRRGANDAQHPVDPKRVRDAVGAEIIRLIWRQPTFGRVKFHKLTYLAEVHVGIPEIGGGYDRDAAGPYDRALIQELEANLKAGGLVGIQQPGGASAEVSYRFTGNEKTVAETAKQMLGNRLALLHDLIKLLGDLKTDSVEAVATLYAVWNDMLLDGRTPDDKDLIDGVLKDWHPEKGKKFKLTDLTHWLNWMRRHEFTPKGRGPRTTRTHLLI